MSEEQLADLEKAAKRNALMAADAVLDLIAAVRMARWQAENYRKLADYYREGGKNAAECGAAELIRSGDVAR